MQSEGKCKDNEDRQQIDLKDKLGENWRVVFIALERDDNGYPENVIRMISFHRKS